MNRAAPWATAIIGGLIGATAAAGVLIFATPQTVSSRIVRQGLLANPEVIMEAADALRDRQTQPVVDANRAALEKPFGSSWAGAEKPDVTLVEFFDYACAYCRKSNADVDRLLREDPKLKVVWREWPVLGPDSEAAARASLAAAQAGRFKPFHDSLFAAGRPTPEALARARSGAGLGTDLPPSVADPELARNFELARGLEASGTPTFVVGDQILQGAVGYEALRDAVKEARARKG